MSFASKYNRVSDFPQYNVEYHGWADVIQKDPQTVTWLGSYNGKYGAQPYVDLAPTDAVSEHKRVRLPKWMLEEIDKIAHSEDMEDIKAGKVGVLFKPYKTKDGNDAVHVEWVDL